MPGPGSGKTRAVVAALDAFREKHGQAFRESGQKVAVITYTNAACDEIRRRIDFDSIFAVSTIHSFAWELIRPFHSDISNILEKRLTHEIEELNRKQEKFRAGTKAAFEREIQIKSKQNRLQRLATVKQFAYNPNGENTAKNSLNHAEVIALAATLLSQKQLKGQILVQKHPVVIIDESQDTQKDVIDALFGIQKIFPHRFCLSLFGDTMQRIYADGKEGLESAVPEDWKRPAISVNYRCPKRVVTLLNKIRSAADGDDQTSRPDADDGFVRVFLINNVDDEDKPGIGARSHQSNGADHVRRRVEKPCRGQDTCP